MKLCNRVESMPKVVYELYILVLLYILLLSKKQLFYLYLLCLENACSSLYPKQLSRATPFIMRFSQ